MRNRFDVLIAALRRRLAQDSGFAAQLRRSAGKGLDRPALLLHWYSFLAGLPEGTIRQDPASQSRALLIAGLFAMDRNQYRGSAEAPPVTPPGEEPGAGQQVGSASSPDAAPKRRRSFGATLRGAAIRTPIEDDPLARRLARLVDSVMTPDGGGTLPWRLRQLVRLVLSRGREEIDWVQLAFDLDAWDRDDRSVQKRWAADFFRIADDAEDRQSVAASTS